MAKDLEIQRQTTQVKKAQEYIEDDQSDQTEMEYKEKGNKSQPKYDKQSSYASSQVQRVQ